MHAHRLRAEQILEHGREEVLAGVLLHVVEPSNPIDPSVETRTRAASSGDDEHVGDSLVLVDDVDDGHAAEQASVVRLAA